MNCIKLAGAIMNTDNGGGIGKVKRSLVEALAKKEPAEQIGEKTAREDALKAVRLAVDRSLDGNAWCKIDAIYTTKVWSLATW